MRTLVLYGSSRRHGNSETLTDLVLKEIPCTRIYLSDVHIKPVVDQRHIETGYAPVDDDYDQITEQVLAHDLLVFGAPIYWYGMPAPMKLFFDRWSQNLRDKRYQFKATLAQKEAYVVLTGGDNPRVKGLPLIQQFQYIFGFVGMTFGGYVIGRGDRPQAVLQDHRALAEAAALNRILREKAEQK
ncbi:MAG: flavodoxin family protein [Symbiobacteriaceae bacterium]|jgi:multimeric flavodoxin WrbA|nr:flavodoxin family protein [Symbiobacteriaceae bacterium]